MENPNTWNEIQKLIDDSLRESREIQMAISIFNSLNSWDYLNKDFYNDSDIIRKISEVIVEHEKLMNAHDPEVGYSLPTKIYNMLKDGYICNH